MQRRGIPRAVLTSGLIVGAFNIFGTLGVLAAVPAEETDVTRIFATPSSPTWSMGTNRAAVEAAKACELPALFGVVHPRHGTPIDSAVLACEHRPAPALRPGGAHCRGTALDFAVDLRMVFMMPYVLMCLAFVRLRRADPRPRPYRMPLGDRLASLWALFVALHVLAGIGLSVVAPGAPMDWAYAGKIVGGVALVMAADQLLIRQAARRRGGVALRGAYG
ncbi:hypothetical protein ACM9NN_06975 [Pseudomonas paraeruginosa]|uniref:hypothetical protein n=1 Tax=Pseudomonas paraeruginosa TaxID=2994495 RepID=UPI003A4C7FA6